MEVIFNSLTALQINHCLLFPKNYILLDTIQSKQSIVSYECINLFYSCECRNGRKEALFSFLCHRGFKIIFFQNSQLKDETLSADILQSSFGALAFQWRTRRSFLPLLTPSSDIKKSKWTFSISWRQCLTLTLPCWPLHPFTCRSVN